jgi:hypothetical protein
MNEPGVIVTTLHKVTHGRVKVQFIFMKWLLQFVQARCRAVTPADSFCPQIALDEGGQRLTASAISGGVDEKKMRSQRQLK